jgi:hypothetical protein
VNGQTALALILVGHVDRRVVPALTLAATLSDYELRAMHIAIDPLTTEQLAHDWMALGLALPLQIEEPVDASLVGTVRSIVERETGEHRRVLVIVPELDLDRWWQTLLHRSTGRRIARGLAALRRVSTVVLPYPL